MLRKTRKTVRAETGKWSVCELRQRAKANQRSRERGRTCATKREGMVSERESRVSPEMWKLEERETESGGKWILTFL